MTEHHDCEPDVEPEPGFSSELWECPSCGRHWRLVVNAHYEPEDS